MGAQHSQRRGHLRCFAASRGRWPRIPWRRLGRRTALHTRPRRLARRSLAQYRTPRSKRVAP
eukprot:39881-Rhodomonas_salina.3